MTPPPPRRVVRPAPGPAAPLTPPPDAPPSQVGVAKSAALVDDAGRPTVRLNDADNWHSILAMTRRALRDAGHTEAEVDAATEALMTDGRADPAGVAARYVEVVRD